MKQLVVFFIAFMMLGCSERRLPNEPPSGGGGSGSTLLEGSLSGLLPRSQSPFKVTRDIVVDSVNTLTIEAGVTLFFQDSTRLLVRGKLICIGTSSRPILFSSFSGSWGGIVITGSSQVSVFKFAIVESVDVPTSGDPDRNGVLEVSHSRVTITNCIFKNNKGINGGAVSLDGSQSLITNCLFVNNYATTFGGAVLSSASSNQITNNTFLNNFCVNYGGGVVLDMPVLDEIQNNIFFMNRSGSGDPRIAYLSTDSSHYISQFNFLASGSMDPLFVSTTDLHLRSNSTCVDAGNPAPQYNDADGSRNDLGAYGGSLGGW